MMGQGVSGHPEVVGDQNKNTAVDEKQQHKHKPSQKAYGSLCGWDMYELMTDDARNLETPDPTTQQHVRGETSAEKLVLNKTYSLTVIHLDFHQGYFLFSPG